MTTALICAVLGWASHAVAQQLPPGFNEEIVFSGLTEPTAVAFASDGRVFVAEKSGLIKVFGGLFAGTPTIFADLRANVYNYKKSGLLGLALDPDFPTQPYVYVLYTYDGPVGGTTPTWGDTCPLANSDNCAVSARLSRLQANSNVMTGAEQVLVADWYQRYPNQPVGALAFGPEGALYASAGDGASSTIVDYGQGTGASPDPANEGGALRSQDLRTAPDPVALSGSIIRVHPDTGQPVPQTPSMLVGPPTVDANGVKSYAVTSEFQGSDPTIVRVLEPTNPAPGKPHRFLYVLPVESGVTGLNSLYSDGLEELRLLNVHNRYNLTLVAPSFHISPWYGDHDSNPDRRLESFMIKDLVPFGDSFAPPGEIHQRWLIGFSKSGFGALTLILRNPNVFSAAAAWDAPAQLTDTAQLGMAENFGTEQNFDRYEIPPLVLKNSEPFLTRNRIWISGDDSAWTPHMAQLHQQMTQAGILHTWVQGGIREHSWDSGWLDGAVTSLDATATATAPVDSNAQRIIAYGLRSPSRIAFRPGTGELWVGDAGWNDWEEINRIPDAADGIIENFGWPCFEGTGTNAYAAAGLGICTQLFAEPTAVTPPAFAYHHSQPVVAGESCGTGSGTISGIAFYDTGGYPTGYHGALFFADASRNCIWVIFDGTDGVPDPASRMVFESGVANPVDLKIGPAGNLFFVDSAGGTIRRIIYSTIPVDTTAPSRSNGLPSGTLAAGTTQATLSLTTNENAICRYATAAGVAYALMPFAFTASGGTAHSTAVNGLANGSSYSFFVRCQDAIGNTNTTDFTISFSVAQSLTTVTAFPSSTTILTGTLNSGSATSLNSDNNVYFAVNSTTSGTRTTAWYGSFTGVSKSLVSLAVNYKGNNSASCTQTVAIWRWSTSAWVQLDSRSVGTTEIAINNLTPTGTLADYISGTDTSGELRVRIQCQTSSNFTNRGDLMSIVYQIPVAPPPPDTTGPVRSNGSPNATLAAGTTQATLSLTTSENATCRHAGVGGVAYGSMVNIFTSTGGTAHSATVSGLTNGSSYSYYVRCQDGVGNANPDDYLISFAVGTVVPQTIYQASFDFSSTQGFRNWYYLYGAGTPMTFVGGNWQGNETYLLLYPDGGHPGNVSDAIRRWQAPQAGSITITGTASDNNTTCGSGASVYVKKNSTILGQQALANGNTTGVSFNLATTVVAGDNIDFGINRGADGNWNCDATYFDPTIVFTP